MGYVAIACIILIPYFHFKGVKNKREQEIEKKAAVSREIDRKRAVSNFGSVENRDRYDEVYKEFSQAFAHWKADASGTKRLQKNLNRNISTLLDDNYPIFCDEAYKMAYEIKVRMDEHRKKFGDEYDYYDQESIRLNGDNGEVRWTRDKTLVDWGYDPKQIQKQIQELGDSQVSCENLLTGEIMYQWKPSVKKSGINLLDKKVNS